tara:strand:- start:512 stop:1807 length:1296 start_codon:yes stop_codon:yes gene_type:complete
MKKKFKGHKFNTLSVHAGQKLDKNYKSRALPIYQTTSYVFDNANEASSIFNLETDGYIYTRISNPTISALEERIAALENGIGAICVASGQAALHLTVATLLNKGDHILSSDRIYGGSRNLLGLTMKRFGIETTFVNPLDYNLIKKSIKKNTKMFFAETIANPGLEVLDLPKISKIFKKKNIPIVVDNTIATPFLLNPINHGADIIIHSATKFLGGHGVAIGGVIVDSGNFDWKASKKFKNITDPYEGYNGLNYYEEFGPAAFLMRARSEGLRDFGASLSPQNAFYILMGVETLGPRMMKHVSNCQFVASFLSGREEVNWVSYPGLKSHDSFKVASKLLPRGAGAILSFGIKGGKDSAIKFINNLKVFSHLANIGDSRSLVIHPYSTTHSQLSEKDLNKAGISEDLIRLSVGLEDLEDLLEDLNLSLKKAVR